MIESLQISRNKITLNKWDMEDKRKNELKMKRKISYGRIGK